MSRVCSVVPSSRPSMCAPFQPSTLDSHEHSLPAVNLRLLMPLLLLLSILHLLRILLIHPHHPSSPIIFNPFSLLVSHFLSPFSPPHSPFLLSSLICPLPTYLSCLFFSLARFFFSCNLLFIQFSLVLFRSFLSRLIPLLSVPRLVVPLQLVLSLSSLYFPFPL